MMPLKARKNEYTFCDLESNVPKNAGLLMTGSHENAPVLFQIQKNSGMRFGQNGQTGTFPAGIIRLLPRNPSDYPKIFSFSSELSLNLATAVKLS